MIVSLRQVTVARAAKPVLQDLDLQICAGDRIFIAGENGAGKSSLLALLAGRLHPYGSDGSRSYAWDYDTGQNFRTSCRHVAFVSCEEQHRLHRIHAASTLRDFLLGHSDGADFLYRELTEADELLVDALFAVWHAQHLGGRKVKTLSLGEMRLALILRAAMHERKLYIFDELFSSLSGAVLSHVTSWIASLPENAAVLMTSHDSERAAQLHFTRHFIVAQGILTETQFTATTAARAPLKTTLREAPEFSPHEAETLIECRQANFFHDFTCIFRGLSFSLHQGDRVLLSGPNGAGKSTLMRIMHGDLYPE